MKRRIHLTAQSGDLVANPMDTVTNTSHETEQNVQFLDESLGTTAGFRYVDGLQHSDTTTTTEMKDFLSRPVRIATFTWAESDLPGVLGSINPWHLFFNNAYVKLKTSNFAFVRCNLKVKVLINASPFYYGAMLMAYQPVPVITPTTIKPGGGFNWFIPQSQRPHLWIYPANSEGGEMTLPFFWNRNWLRTQVAQDFIDMGKLDFTGFTTLQSANGVSTAGVTVQIYAWAEDVELSGSSLGLVMQTDEYGSGVISKPASAVAELAGRLSKDPVVGRFATATQIGASALAKAASLFGFSNPPVIAPTMNYRPTAFPQMASSEIGHPAEKLALDPKNEVSVDPSVVGLPSEDPLDVASLVQRESYITEIAWASTDAVDTMLFSSYVTPEMFAVENISQGSLIYGTPSWYVSRMFNAWRGDIIFRFKFVATQYHKGRVRISWDPAGTTTSNLFNVADSANVVQTAVIDLGKDTDVEFRVPFHQALPWLQTSGTPVAGQVPFSVSPTRTWAPSPYVNGALTVRVQTSLTAPVATSNVVMMVFVRGAENLEFANPGMAQYPLSQFVPQTSELATGGIDGDDSQLVVAGKTVAPPRERYLVNFGETVKSLRTLLYRHYLTNVTQATHAAGTDLMYYRAYFYRLPCEYGYDPNGRESAKGLITPASSFPFNYNIPDPLTWILAPFVAYRGSTTLTINTASAGVLNHIRFFRRPTNSVGVTSSTFTSLPFVGASDTAYNSWNNLDGGSSGSAITATRTQQGLSVVFPQYSVSKFDSTSVNYRNAANTNCYQQFSGLGIQLHMSAAGTSNQSVDTKLEWYWAGGPDLTPLFFLNIPTLVLYNSVPAP
jgi:hypothetical protein